MGELKDKKLKKKAYQLDKYEYNFIKAIALARNNSYNQYQGIISTFLSYLAGTKWGYKDELLDFELDDENQQVFISPHPEESESAQPSDGAASTKAA